MNAKLSTFPKVSLFAAALFVFTADIRADVEDKVIKSFQVQSGGQLLVQADRGSITVETAEVEAVNIEITRTVTGSQSKAEQALKDHVITTTQKDHVIDVRAENKGRKSSGWFSSPPQLKVSYRITVPRQFDVNLKTAGGSISVGQLTGKVQADTSGGSLKFEKIKGPLTARTSGGTITVAGCKGAVEVASSGGSLNLSDIEGDVSARTSGGSIRVDKITGKSVVHTSGGSINVARIDGSIEADTSGGSITASLSEQPSGDCSFKTSGGSVTIGLGKKTAVDVDAHATAGRITTDFAVISVIKGEQKKNELRGKINGGGPLITAHTSGGSIRLEEN